MGCPNKDEFTSLFKIFVNSLSKCMELQRPIFSLNPFQSGPETRFYFRKNCFSGRFLSRKFSNTLAGSCYTALSVDKPSNIYHICISEKSTWLHDFRKSQLASSSPSHKGSHNLP